MFLKISFIAKLLIALIWLNIFLSAQVKEKFYWQGDQNFLNLDPSKLNPIIANKFTYVTLNFNNIIDIPALANFYNSTSLKKCLILDRRKNNYSLLEANPFNRTEYNEILTNLANLITNYNSYYDGILTDFEIPAFPAQAYYENGVDNPDITKNYDDRLFRPTSNAVTRNYFKEYLLNKYQGQTFNVNLNSLNMDKIQFNLPIISIDNTSNSTLYGFILGYYGPAYDGGQTLGNYHRIAQTFKPINSKISKIEIKIKREYNFYGGNTTKFPKFDLRYYITGINSDGSPNLNDKKSLVTRYIMTYYTDYNGNSGDFNGIIPISLYFDPDEMNLETTKTYAFIIELANDGGYVQNVINEWQGAYYMVAVNQVLPNGTYNNGKIFKGAVDINGNPLTWYPYPEEDMWFKIYTPSRLINNKRYDLLHKDWIDFQTDNTKLTTMDLVNRAHTYGQKPIKIFIYSGYQDKIYYNESIMEHYSLDWSKLKLSEIDYAICGYGNQNPAATQSALGSIPLLGGTYSYAGHRAIASEFDERFNSCNGGAAFAFWETNCWADVLLTFSISGPSEIYHPAKGYPQQVYKWNAVVAGGTAPYSYKWFWNGVQVGTSSSYSCTLGFDGYYSPIQRTLRLEVKDNSSPQKTVTVTKTIVEHSASDWPPAKAKGDFEIEVLPTEYAAQQNYPNPFNPETKIKFELPEQSNVKLIIYDILGREIITLEDKQLTPGYYEKSWRGLDENGRQVASGIYFCRFYAKGESGKEYNKVMKMMMVK